jgi:hypothetical protein
VRRKKERKKEREKERKRKGGQLAESYRRGRERIERHDRVNRRAMKEREKEAHEQFDQLVRLILLTLPS